MPVCGVWDIRIEEEGERGGLAYPVLLADQLRELPLEIQEAGHRMKSIADMVGREHLLRVRTNHPHAHVLCRLASGVGGHRDAV